MGNLIGNEVSSNFQNITQVYQATHDGVGNSLPYMNRSFVSFTYGGKAIEDFNLIATIPEKKEINLYSSFSDSTTTYDMLDGQLYWGTRLEPNKLNLILATDEISENQLDDFREWFAPGVERELILAEHPNRAILARVSSSPIISCIPFEKQTTINIDNFSYNTSTTIYKGEISLEFVMDDPFWYSKLNYMPNYLDKKTLEPLNLEDENINKIETLTDKDMIKIILEDRIPSQEILTGEYFLGGNILVTHGSYVDHTYIGDRIGIFAEYSQGLNINNNTPAFLFYSGTTKSYPTIKFSLIMQFNNDGYIISPKNTITSDSYSNITIGNNVFLFTTPNILTSYNKAIKIFYESNSFNKIDLMDKVREKVTEYYARAWAIRSINKSTSLSELREEMKKFFYTNDISFIINSKTGESVGTFNIRYQNNDGQETPLVIEENVGDMIKSNYLIIEGRDRLNSTGQIETFHTITSSEDLNDFLIFYKNMYL